MLNFIAANLPVFAAIYFIVGGLTFLAVLFLFYGVYRANAEMDSTEDGYYPNHRNAYVSLTLGCALFIGALAAVFWPLAPLVLLAVFIYSIHK